MVLLSSQTDNHSQQNNSIRYNNINNNNNKTAPTIQAHNQFINIVSQKLSGENHPKRVSKNPSANQTFTASESTLSVESLDSFKNHKTKHTRKLRLLLKDQNRLNFTTQKYLLENKKNHWTEKY